MCRVVGKLNFSFFILGAQLDTRIKWCTVYTRPAHNIYFMRHNLTFTVLRNSVYVCVCVSMRNCKNDGTRILKYEVSHGVGTITVSTFMCRRRSCVLVVIAFDRCITTSQLIRIHITYS